MKSLDYTAWGAYLLDLVEQFQFEKGPVLELAAGTGNITRFLQLEYSELFMTDISYQMISHSNLPVPKICCDMRALPFNCQFALIFCIFDSLNYITEEKELRKFFKDIRNYLSPSGKLIFDMSLESNSKKHEQIIRPKFSYKGLRYEQMSSYNTVTGIHTNIFRITDKYGNTKEEVHIQKVYPLEFILGCIDEAGFTFQKCYEAFTWNPATPECDRVQFIVGH